MYTKGELSEDYSSGNLYMREILDPDGDVIALVPEYKFAPQDGSTMADTLLSHLNRN